MNFKSFFLTTAAVGIGVALANGNLMNTINTVSEKAQEQMMVAADPMMQGANELLDPDTGSKLGYIHCEKGSLKLNDWDRWYTADEATKIAIQNDNAFQLYGLSTTYAMATAACVMNGRPFGNAYRSMPIR